MKNLPTVLKDKYTGLALAAAFLLLLFGFSLAYVNLADSQSLIVIHFDAYRGADYFGTQSDVWDILATATAVWIINLILANEFYFRERILSYILAANTLLFMVLILVAVNVIININ